MPFTSHAQNLEDVMLWRALKHVANGCYIDVGACEPEAESVTKAFYDRNWNGINIEPSAAAFHRLEAARPRDLNLNLACGSSEGEIDFLLVEGGNGLSTSRLDAEAGLRRQGWSTSKARVASRTLSSICQEHVNSPIHFLKIDCEGAEHDVLAGADLNTWRPWIAVVEATVANSTEPTHAQWEHLLLDAGYSMVYADGLNRFYLANEHQDLAPAFAMPPNVFDNYVTAREAGIGTELAQQRDEALKLVASLTRERDEALDQLTSLTLERDTALQEVWESNRLAGALAADRQKLLDELQARPQHNVSAELSAVYSSTSWRLTAPLRAVSRFGGRR